MLVLSQCSSWPQGKHRESQGGHDRSWVYISLLPTHKVALHTNAGIKMAVVSNFDLRLRPLLEALGLDKLFDALIISAEVGTSCVCDFCP